MLEWYIWHSLGVLIVGSLSFSLGYYAGIKKKITSLNLKRIYK